MPQEVVKQQAAPVPPAHDISSPERCSIQEESYEDQHTSVTMNADTFPMPFMCSKQTL